MAQRCGQREVETWSDCLMPNHVHLIAVPSWDDGLRWGIGSAPERYTRRINFRQHWRSYLWQRGFASFVMDEPYLLAAARYVKLNPVGTGLVVNFADRPWISMPAHLSGRDDRLVKVAPLFAMVADWRAFSTVRWGKRNFASCVSTVALVDRLKVVSFSTAWRA